MQFYSSIIGLGGKVQVPAHDDIEDPTEKIICCRCVGEDFLKQEISKRGESGTCSYCKDVDSCISIVEIADRVEIAFEEHYYRTSTEPSDFEYTMIKESDYVWGREGDNVVDAIEGAEPEGGGPSLLSG